MRTLEDIWRDSDAMEVRLTAPLSERMLELAQLAPGQRVLDLATGRGEPAVRAAHRVAPGGVVVGVDVAPTMLAFARERADYEEVTNLELRVMSATALEPMEPFDAVLSRWGLMYVDAPRVALAQAAHALRPRGRLVLAVWAEPEHVPYFTWPRAVLASLVPVPPVDRSVPGTFHCADEARLRDDVTHAGFDVELVETHELPVMEAPDPEGLVRWVLDFGLRRLLAPHPPEVHAAWEAKLVAEAERFRGRDGWFRLGGRTRVLSAVRR